MQIFTRPYLLISIVFEYKAYDVMEKGGVFFHPGVPAYIMWTLLNINGFAYSEDVEKYYILAENELDDFSKAFMDTAFRFAAARLVIALHYNKTDEAKSSYHKLMELSSPGHISAVQPVLDSHRATDRLTVNSPAFTAFLGSLKFDD